MLDLGLDMDFLNKKKNKNEKPVIKEIIHRLYYKILNLKYLNTAKSQIKYLQKLCQKFDSFNI